MGTFLRFVLPLLIGLAALAAVAGWVVDETTRAWFMRDVALRARLATAGAQETLASHLMAGDRRKLAAVLDGLARRGWTSELRRALTFARGDAPPPGGGAGRSFRPILADVRQLVAELARERASAAGGPWTSERLQRTPKEALQRAHRRPREPRAVHPRADGGGRHQGSPFRERAGHGARAGDARLLGHADRAREQFGGLPPRSTSAIASAFRRGEESYALRRVWLTKYEEIACAR